jgi:hypothetical protein
VNTPLITVYGTLLRTVAGRTTVLVPFEMFEILALILLNDWIDREKGGMQVKYEWRRGRRQ